MGLLPFLALKSLFKKLTLNLLEKNQLEHIAQIESPLYERWNRITKLEFEAAQAKFLVEEKK